MLSTHFRLFSNLLCIADDYVDEQLSVIDEKLKLASNEKVLSAAEIAKQSAEIDPCSVKDSKPSAEQQKRAEEERIKAILQQSGVVYSHNNQGKYRASPLILGSQLLEFLTINVLAIFMNNAQRLLENPLSKNLSQSKRKKMFMDQQLRVILLKLQLKMMK